MLLVDEILRQFGERIVNQLKLDIGNKKITKFGAVNASGKLKESIRYEVSSGTLRVYALGYSYFLEFGRKPGKRPPTAAIAQWIEDKGIVPDGKISKKSLAFLIAKKIGEKGSLIYQQGGSDLLSGIINEDLINDIKSEVFTAITDSVVNSFRSNVLKMAA